MLTHQLELRPDSPLAKLSFAKTGSASRCLGESLSLHDFTSANVFRPTKAELEARAVLEHQLIRLGMSQSNSHLYYSSENAYAMVIEPADVAKGVLGFVSAGVMNSPFTQWQESTIAGLFVCQCEVPALLRDDIFGKWCGLFNLAIVQHWQLEGQKSRPVLILRRQLACNNSAN